MYLRGCPSITGLPFPAIVVPPILSDVGELRTVSTSCTEAEVITATGSEDSPTACGNDFRLVVATPCFKVVVQFLYRNLYAVLLEELRDNRQTRGLESEEVVACKIVACIVGQMVVVDVYILTVILYLKLRVLDEGIEFSVETVFLLLECQVFTTLFDESIVSVTCYLGTELRSVCYNELAIAATANSVIASHARNTELAESVSDLDRPNLLS